MYVGSQWFALPRHVVQWFIEDPLPMLYESYAQHVVVADENYFSTLVSNSPYCEDIIRKKNLFLLFDKWENELSAVHERDRRKCLSPDPDHCGRSPSTLTIKFKNLLEITRSLFARKFDPRNAESLQLLDVIDSWRKTSLDDREVMTVSVGDEGQKMMVRFTGLRPSVLPDLFILNKGSKGSKSRIDAETTHKNSSSSVTMDVDVHGNPFPVENISEDEETDTMENYDFCWEIGEVGEVLTLGVCDASQPSQWFTLGKKQLKNYL